MARALGLIFTLILAACQTTAKRVTAQQEYVRVDGRSLNDPVLRAEMQARGRQCLALAHSAATRGRSPSITQNNIVVVEQPARRHDLDFISSNPASDAFREGQAASQRVIGDPDTLEIEMNACMARHGYILR